jgi:hypothetical protein
VCIQVVVLGLLFCLVFTSYITIKVRPGAGSSSKRGALQWMCVSIPVVRVDALRAGAGERGVHMVLRYLYVRLALLALGHQVRTCQGASASVMTVVSWSLTC